MLDTDCLSVSGRLKTVSSMTWVLESGVFPDSHEQLRIAIQRHGEEIVDWQDDWLRYGELPPLNGSPAVFHGSLGNAATIANRGVRTDVERPRLRE